MSSKPTSNGRTVYAALWRWHFYAGLYVVLFLLMLATTGILMLISGPLENIQYSDRYFVAPGDATISPSKQLSAVRAAYPHTVAVSYKPPGADDRSSRFAVLPHEADAGGHAAHWELPTLLVYVNPYTGDVLGDLDPNTTLYNRVLEIHGTFLAGDTGDYLIEIAAGFAVLLIVSGLYMRWSAEGRRRDDAHRRSAAGGSSRGFWRNLHVQVGTWTSPLLLFFLISGLTWTLVWGDRFTQAWSTLPGEQFEAPLDEKTHASLNMTDHHEMPWAVEKTPMPASGSTAGFPGIRAGNDVDLDAVVRFADSSGLTRFRVAIPGSNAEVWTVASVTQSGDINDPSQDRIIHIDKVTGNVLADISFQDYSVLGKAMAVSIPLHQGDMGTWNLVVNGLICVLIIGLAGSGVAMWWKRRSADRPALQPPPRPVEERLWHATLFALLAVSLLFPLVAVTLVALFALDYFVVSRVPVLGRVLK